MRRKKKKKNNILLKIILLLIVIIFMIYSCSEIINLLKKPTDIITVDNGRISSEISAVGYIIRDEVVLKGENYKNGIYQIKSEKEKVALGENVFRYYTKDEESLSNKIKELDNKISELEDNDNEIFSSDLKVIENEIENIVNEYHKTNDVQKIKEYESNISELIKKKTKIMGELSPSGSKLKELIQERSSYESKLNSGSEYVKAPKSRNAFL